MPAQTGAEPTPIRTKNKQARHPLAWLYNVYTKRGGPNKGANLYGIRHVDWAGARIDPQVLGYHSSHQRAGERGP